MGVRSFGDAAVIRYREDILPLVHVNTLLGYSDDKSFPEVLRVVVIRRGGRLYGLCVDDILDTLSVADDLIPSPKKQVGLFGSLNLKSELIVVVDPFELIEKAYPQQTQKIELQTQKPQNNSTTPFTKKESKTKATRVLFVEDTVFFRKTVKSYLEKAGYDVTTATDGKEALEILKEREKDFDIIISDIEMPRMNGFDLAISVKQSTLLSQIPLLALSSRADEDYLRKGREAGFDLYLEKLKTDELLRAVQDLLSKKQEAA